MNNRWNAIIYRLWTPVYDWLLDFHPATARRANAIRLLNLSKGSRVLLVGCGTGADIKYLADTELVVGVDVVPEMLLKSICRASTNQIRFCGVQSNAEVLPFRNDSFDAVILSLVLSVVADPRQCLNESVRVIREDGRILVLDKFRNDDMPVPLWRRFLNPIMRLFGTDINRSWSEMSHGIADAESDSRDDEGSSFRTIVALPALGTSFPERSSSDGI